MKSPTPQPTMRTRLLSALFTATIAITTHSALAASPSGIQAESWLVIDGESGQVLAEHNADAHREPASLTKLMTAYLVFDALKRGALSWDEKVRISADDTASVKSDEAQMYLMAGREVAVRDLVRGLIVASANDAALVLAKRLGGSLAGFEQMMNSKARELGMNDSHFASPSGITTPNHYSTARDLSTLALRLTSDFPEYYSFSSQQHFEYGRFKKQNKNWLLGTDPSVDGLKTGHTKAAGFCIIATARRQQSNPPMKRRVFAVLLGAATAKQRISGAHTLLEYGFGSFRDYPAEGAGHQVVTQPLQAGATVSHRA
ncbi:D-alanyl-D-alanine carboxypeptidase family protein [Paraburkholderia sp. BL21I4N1]|uniref:D-alanyl-D-alanine carboxypeptidase family protein n=1 Tax=Paraburkholderia sp. BL21I4N1 TaxID=1938801 RepID=UPI000CFB1333|nr:D-alanyl-D-alanine carboxypeptidase family protein [Paraburkholderia sp. BL21I4N1]PQV53188.1 D-alanyl-D-alanine carboxypeptidase (penicillin-binding protein 5/6) [Paraburkholderia sp. BL21I4N1]